MKEIKHIYIMKKFYSSENMIFEYLNVYGLIFRRFSLKWSNQVLSFNVGPKIAFTNFYMLFSICVQIFNVKHLEDAIL